MAKRKPLSEKKISRLGKFADRLGVIHNTDANGKKKCHISTVKRLNGYDNMGNKTIRYQYINTPIPCNVRKINFCKPNIFDFQGCKARLAKLNSGGNKLTFGSKRRMSFKTRTRYYKNFKSMFLPTKSDVIDNLTFKNLRKQENPNVGALNAIPLHKTKKIFKEWISTKVPAQQYDNWENYRKAKRNVKAKMSRDKRNKAKAAANPSGNASIAGAIVDAAINAGVPSSEIRGIVNDVQVQIENAPQESAPNIISAVLESNGIPPVVAGNVADSSIKKLKLKRASAKEKAAKAYAEAQATFNKIAVK